MAILVTGGAGYIGSHMVWKLIDSGEEVVVADNLATGFDWAVAPDASLEIGDIGDISFLEGIANKKQIEAVIHFAGSVVVPESVANPLFYYENNTAKSRTLIEFAIRHKIDKFIFSSTAAVYGNVGSEPVSENYTLAPESPYGRSKLMTEMMLQDASAAHAFRFAALRYFNVAGSDPLGRTGQSTKGATHLLKVACETVAGKRPSISVFGTDYATPDGTCLRDYIHVSDLVNAHYLALKMLRNGGTSIIANCGYGRGFSVLDVINTVKRVSGRDFQVDHGPRRPGDPAAVVANPERAMVAFGWKPNFDDLQIIVETALNWERKLSERNYQ